MKTDNFRIYHYDKVVIFCKTREKWGELSNMASGFPLYINGLKIPSSEALYQACRFPDHPKIQKMIIEQSNAMYAKRIAKEYTHYSREDWNQYRILIMKWCLRVKLLQHLDSFGRVLLETKEFPIVELSRRDNFWGAYPTQNNLLLGQNVLGRLLMEIRETIKSNNTLLGFRTPNIPNFYLLNNKIQEVILPSDFKIEKKKFPELFEL